MQALTLDIIQKLPKAELHCHLGIKNILLAGFALPNPFIKLKSDQYSPSNTEINYDIIDGSVRAATIIELAQEQRIELPSYDLEELKKIVSVDLDCKSLEEYLRGFEITLRVLQRAYAITRVMYEVCEDAVKDGVKYLEVRFSPILHVEGGLSLSGVMEAIIQGLVMAEYRLPIKAQIIVCGMRQLPSSITLNLAEIAWRFRHKGVVGFDLAGPEQGFSSKHHKEAFDLIRSKCINCTLHSGEGAGWESVLDSIQFCGAHRIGHGVRLIQNQELLNHVADRGIAIEVCITSNVQTKAIAKLEDHPIRQFYDSGIIVVPGTDNVSVSKVTLSGEYYQIHKLFNFNVEEIVHLIDNGFKASFMDVISKKRIRAEVFRDCIVILKHAGIDLSGFKQQKHSWWTDIGVDLDDLLAPSKLPFWGSHVNPEITRELVNALPKTDLHCNLDGSVSIEWLWNQLTHHDVKVKELFSVECNTAQELEELLKQQTEHSALLCKRIIKQVLQTREQIESAVDDIATHAIDDGVRYMELAFRPQTHTLGKLSPQEALQILLAKVRSVNEQHQNVLKVAVVVYVSTVADDPIVFKEIAELAVQHRHEVCGFGIFGDKEIGSHEAKYFASTVNYLKKMFMNVAIYCSSVDSIMTALSFGGARRISGAFYMHKFPRLMSYLADHRVPVELSLTSKLLQKTGEVKTFSGNPIGLFIDNEVPVTICSFRALLSKYNRNETIYRIIHECGLSISQVLSLLSNGFSLNFQPLATRNAMMDSFRKESYDLLTKKGYQYLTKKQYSLH